VIAADRGYVGLLVALPLIMGLLALAVPAATGFGPASQAGVAPGCAPNRNTDAVSVLLVLAIGACLTGTANAVRELVKERVIYERERATGLSRSAYLTSKVLVLGVVTALQGLLLAVIGLFGRRMPAHGLRVQPAEAELVLAVVVLAVVSMLIGLVISSVVATAEKTMPLLVLVTVCQVVFTGTVFPVFNQVGLAQLAWLSPSRWAVAAQAATIDLRRIGPPVDPAHPSSVDALWAHTAGQWTADAAVLLVLGLGFALLTSRLLRRHEPAVMRRR
jgi:hypothetical protein